MSARALLGLLALQLALAGIYFAVEASRTEPTPFQWERLDEPAPALVLSRDGAAVSLPAGGHLVHFWATWCAPCQAELPDLLHEARARGVPVLAVTEEPWPTVHRYFAGEVPPEIVQGSSAGWQVSGLPDTYAVADGRLLGRVGGPRAWSGGDPFFALLTR